MKSYYLLFLLAASLMLNTGVEALAQQPAVTENVTYQITGKVVDKGTGQPIAYATAVLLEAGTAKTITGGVADDNGEFFLAGFKEGKYTLQVSFVGYTALEQAVTVTAGKTSLVLGNIALEEESVALQEVTVRGQRDLIEERVDRTIYNAENDKTTVGGDASDVLRRVPMLSVDLDGNVSMRGSSNIRVLIDNKPSTIAASSVADALKQIPADEIKSVEVITSPSAKYDAEGSGGIINIITKKNNLQGASLSINSSAGLRGSNLGLNASLRKGKMGFTLGGHGRTGYNVKGSFANEQDVTNPDGSVSNIFQSADTRTNNLMGRYNLGWDYEINKFNWVSASVGFGMFNFKSEQDNLLSETYMNEILINSLLRQVNMDNLSNNIDVNFNYTRTYERKGKEFSILGLYSRNNRTNDFVNSLFDNDFETIVSRTKNDNASNNQEFTIQLDYVTPVGTGDKQILEYGAKNIMRRANSDYAYFVADGADGPYEQLDDVQLSNEFDYQQNVTSGYLSYTLGFLKDYTVKGGLRYEYTHIDADFRSEQTAEIPAYGTLVPSLNISRKLNNGNMIKLAYNRRIQRPSLQFLNPNIQAANPLQISQGNPLLDPEFSDNYEIGYNTFYKVASLNLSGFFRNTTGSIQSVRTVQDDGVIYTTFENIGSEKAYGLSLFTNISLSGKFSLNGGIDSYYAVLDNGLPDPNYRATNEGFVLSGRLFGNYNITDTWVIQAFGFGRGRMVQLQGSQGGFRVYGLNLNKEFADKKGSIGFGAENFLTSEFKMKGEIKSPTINQRSVNTMKNMNFKINFSYRIGKMSVGQTPRRKRSIDNQDLKQEGGGGEAVMPN
ncbi:MAG TPA: outer membrane beta-barrel family protein [Cyclobacteriaceae bacterium]|nr:outer membrane beta-barrel family protein [Cyclobacteriaceae bacterium]